MMAVSISASLRTGAMIGTTLSDRAAVSMTQITISLPPPLLAFVRAAAEREYSTQAAVIRRLVAEAAAARQAGELEARA